MEYKKLAGTKISVSKICLGTMTWGEQNSEQEAHEQLDYALSRGINFIDTAEMYPVPGRKETQGATEQYIGSWLKKRKKRIDVVLATKATGPNKGLFYIRNIPDYSRSQILEAINGSLKRLNTDYIDIYQLHWPERNANFFGKLFYEHDQNEGWKDNFAEILNTMNDLIREGKIRHWGLSNETPWGVMHFLHLAEIYKLPRPVSIQNPYSLLNRSFETGLSEICLRENLGMFPYSPLGFGTLSGKYLSEKFPADSRRALFPSMRRYSGTQTELAVKAYVELALKLKLKPAQMALAYVNAKPFVTSTIIGATKTEQLRENIDSILLRLGDEAIAEIEKIHNLYPIPAP